MFGFTARVVTAVALVGSAACASGGASSGSTTAAAPSPQGTTERPARRNANLLTTADFQGMESLNVGDAIQRLRPDWLRRAEARSRATMSRGSDGNDALAVWVDENRAGGAEVLKTMAVQGIASMRYYSGPEAQARFGNGNSNGAIHIVTTASGKKP